jgi:hypothetical protein
MIIQEYSCIVRYREDEQLDKNCNIRRSVFGVFGGFDLFSGFGVFGVFGISTLRSLSSTLLYFYRTLQRVDV